MAPTPGGRCVHLRTKAMYIPEFAAAAFTGNGDEEENSEVVCWCNRTGSELGPDREPVASAPCRNPARECFRTTVLSSI